MQLSLFGLLLLTQPLNSSEQDTRANLEFSSNFGIFKGQSISKGLQFFPKKQTKKVNPKSNYFRLFFGRIENNKRSFWNDVTFRKLQTHFVCTLISENQGLEKLRSVSNLKKKIRSCTPEFFFSTPDFFSVCHVDFFRFMV